MPLKVELKPHERIIIGACVITNTEQRTKLQQLTAPVSGIVQQLSVHTVGGVVTPAQSLAVIVPNDSQLEIEACRRNDLAFRASNTKTAWVTSSAIARSCVSRAAIELIQ